MFRTMLLSILACLSILSTAMAQPVAEAPMPERGTPPPLRFSTYWGLTSNNPPDGEERWTAITSGAPVFNPYNGGRFDRHPAGWQRATADGAIVFPAPPELPDPERLVFEFDQDDRLYVQTGERVLVTDDVGRRWLPIALPEGLTSVIPLVVRHDGQTQLFVGSAQGLWQGTGRIHDGVPEFAWQQVTKDPIRSVALSRDQSRLVVGQSSGEVLVGRFDDDQLVFTSSQPRQSEVAFVAVHPADSLLIVAGYRVARGDGGDALLYVSRDGGEVWEPADGATPGRLPDEPTLGLAFVFYQQSYLAYLFTGHYTYVSEDFLTWAREDSLPENPVSTMAAIAGEVYAQGPTAGWLLAPQAVRCTYEVTPTRVTVAPEGGTYRVTVNVNSSTCAWSVARLPADSPIRILSGSSGRGDGTVIFTVAANNTSRSRTLSLGLANNQVALTQANQPTCSVGLGTGPEYDLPSGHKSGHREVFYVRVNSSLPACEWTIRSSSPALAFSPTSGRGSAVITGILNANETGQTRTITTTFQGQQYTLTQQPLKNNPGSGRLPVACSASADITRFPAGGGVGTLRIEKTSNCGTISLAVNAGWISLGQGSVTANGTTSVSLRVAAHTTSGERRGVISLTGVGSIHVTQSGAAAPSCTKVVVTPSVTKVPAGGGRVSLAVQASGACAASSAQSNQAWARVVPASGGFAIDVDRNPGAARSTTVVVSNPSRAVTGSPIVVHQDGQPVPPPPPPPCVITLPTTYVDLGTNTVVFDLHLNANRADCRWSVLPVTTTDADREWLSVTPSSGVGSGTVRLTAKPARIGGRLAEVTVAGIRVTVTQRGTIGSNGCACVGPACGANMQMSIDRSSFTASGGDTSLRVFAPNNCQWEVHASESFVSFPSGNRGIGNGVVPVRVAPNRLGVSRSAVIRSPQATPANNGSVSQARITQSAN